MAAYCGVITFYSSSHAVHAEKVLKQANYQIELIPGPKEISPNCGVAVRYDYHVTEEITALLLTNGVTYEACHYYEIKQKQSLLTKLLGR